MRDAGASCCACDEALDDADGPDELEEAADDRASTSVSPRRVSRASSVSFFTLAGCRLISGVIGQ